MARWKYNIDEMLVLRAVKMGVINADDCDQDAIEAIRSKEQTTYFEPRGSVTGPSVLEPASNDEAPLNVGREQRTYHSQIHHNV